MPEEILLRIFVLLQDFVPSSAPYRISSWIYITWICRRWRQAAISYPYLWTTIAFGEGGYFNMELWLATFLERVASSPLNVRLCQRMDTSPAGDVGTQDLLRMLTGHAPSFRTFTLMISGQCPDTNWNILIASFSKMITLEKLIIHSSSADADSFTAAFTALQLTREHLPRLRTLALHQVHFPWNSSLYHSLSTLKVADMSPSPSPGGRVPAHGQGCVCL